VERLFRDRFQVESALAAMAEVEFQESDHIPVELSLVVVRKVAQPLEKWVEVEQ
jgi:hypothetical protein